MKLDVSTKLLTLLNEYPFLKEFLVGYNSHYKNLTNPVMISTMGRIATLAKIADIGNIELSTFIQDITDEIMRNTNKEPAISDSKYEKLTKDERVSILKEIIGDMHRGGDKEKAKRIFDSVFSDVDGIEIAEMEQQLIREGMHVSEIQRLCDIHTGTFKTALDKNDELDLPSGHPINTYMEENKIIQKLADDISEALKILADSPSPAKSNIAMKEMEQTIEKLKGINNHYVRKENQLFPFIEKKGVEGPSKVMWGIHDEIRNLLKVVKNSISKFDRNEFVSNAPELVRLIGEMIYKEAKILFPMCLKLLDENDWIEVRRGEDELGYAFATPGFEWIAYNNSIDSNKKISDGSISLDVGNLNIEQLNMMLKILPVDFAFVDENDVVKYYSGGKRHFPRSPAVIGRKVTNCHPPKSVHIVEEILSQFRTGKKDIAEFWFTMHGRFLHIRYFALRDDAGVYKGCIEVGQDITEIKKLEGEQRLLSWGG